VYFIELAVQLAIAFAFLAALSPNLNVLEFGDILIIIVITVLNSLRE